MSSTDGLQIANAGSDVEKQSFRLPTAPKVAGWKIPVALGLAASTFSLIFNACLLLLYGTSLASSAQNPRSMNGFSSQQNDCDADQCGPANASHRSPYSSRIGEIYIGSCDTAQSLDTWLHLGINVLAALLLGASNIAMQCLSAPKRADIDRLHALGQAVDIGIANFRNWRVMNKRRRVLWIVLGLSSLPLHFFYNSVIVSSMAYVDWIVANVPADAVTPNGVTNGFEDSGLPSGIVASLNAFREVVRSGNATVLRTSECLGALRPGLSTDYSRFFLVSSLRVIDVSPESSIDSNFTNNNLLFFITHASDINQDLISVRSANGWDERYMAHDDLISQWEIDPQSASSIPPGFIPGNSVDYCFADKVDDACTVGVVLPYVGIVFGMNTLKIFCFIILLKWKPYDPPLQTLGDAITSFLIDPDKITQEKPVVDLRKNDKRGGYLPQKRGSAIQHFVVSLFRTNSRSWYFGASLRRWTWTLLLCLAFLAAKIGIWVYAASGTSSSILWSAMKTQGVGGPFNAASSSGTPSLITSSNLLLNILLSNSFQIFLSFVYLCCNGLFTSMLLSREWLGYAIGNHKGLRVSSPQDHQRRTFWLTLPYRYSVPLIIIAAFLHWLLSEAIFFEQLQLVDYSVEPPIYQSPTPFTICAMLALTIFIAVWIFLMCCMLAFGKKKYASGPYMPLVRSDSLAISSACHPRPGQYSEGFRKLRWGYYMDGGKRRLGFTSGEVERRPKKTARNTRKDRATTRKHTVNFREANILDSCSTHV